MNLSDYTTEELRAELKQRNLESRKAAAKEKPKYKEWTATIDKIDGNFYILKDGSIPVREWDKFTIKQGCGFNKENKLGITNPNIYQHLSRTGCVLCGFGTKKEISAKIKYLMEYEPARGRFYLKYFDNYLKYRKII